MATLRSLSVSTSLLIELTKRYSSGPIVLSIHVYSCAILTYDNKKLSYRFYFLRQFLALLYTVLVVHHPAYGARLLLAPPALDSSACRARSVALTAR